MWAINAPQVQPQMKNKYKNLIAGFVFLFIFLISLARFQGPATGYWDTYITAPAFLITNHPVHFVSKEGADLYHYRLPGKLPQNLVQKDTYGIISKDQRIGTGIMFAPWFTFFNLFGFRLLFAISILLTAMFIYLTLRLLNIGFMISVFLSFISVLNPYMFSLDKLNPNIIGMMFISIILYLILSKNTSWLLIGLIYGIFGGVRNEGILFLPAILFFLLTSSERKTKDFFLFLSGTFITILPILYWNYFAFGNILMHPTQFKGLEGFRPTFEHKLLFWKFNFNGMFNWPLYSQIVRTPYFAFPVFLLLPLILVNSFGIILIAFMFNGAWRIFKDRLRLFIFLMLWLLPFYLLLCSMENWSELKSTFILLCINPIIIFIALGLNELSAGINSMKYIIRTICFIAIIWSIVRLLFLCNFPADPRWYARFPRILQKGDISFIGDDLRTKPEDPAEVLAQKNELTRGRLIPHIALPKIEVAHLITTIGTELKQDRLTTVDFWKYIYEY